MPQMLAEVFTDFDLSGFVHRHYFIHLLSVAHHYHLFGVSDRFSLKYKSYYNILQTKLGNSSTLNLSFATSS
jgi:hypothetical protein